MITAFLKAPTTLWYTWMGSSIFAGWRALVVGATVGQSAEHRRFEKACEAHGIALKVGKGVTGELTVGVLGGSFLGERGWLALESKKPHRLFWKGLLRAP